MPLISNREFIDKKIQFQDGKAYYIIFRSVEETAEIDTIFPKSKKYVRGFNYINAYKLVEGENCTLYQQISCADISGSIPSYIVNRIAPNATVDFLKTLLKHINHI